MALIKCKECGTEISSKAETCPKCGVRIAAKPMGCGALIGVIFLGGIIVSVFSSIFSSSTSTQTSPSVSAPASISASKAQVQPAPVPKLPGSQWSYVKNSDSMAKGNVYSAYVLSTNTVNFSFPYAGEQHATLTIRTHPRYGRDLIFRIEKGQILCRSYEDCSVLIRFDDEPPVTYSAVGAADNSTEMIFIRNYDKFVGKLPKTNKVRISVNIYHQGAPVFEFDTSGFDQGKYKPAKL